MDVGVVLVIPPPPLSPSPSLFTTPSPTPTSAGDGSSPSSSVVPDAGSVQEATAAGLLSSLSAMTSDLAANGTANGTSSNPLVAALYGFSAAVGDALNVSTADVFDSLGVVSPPQYDVGPPAPSPPIGGAASASPTSISAGAIVGIVVGAVVAIALLAYLAVVAARRRRGEVGGRYQGRGSAGPAGAVVAPAVVVVPAGATAAAAAAGAVAGGGAGAGDAEAAAWRKQQRQPQ